MPRRCAAPLSRAALIALSCLPCVACSPTYDWREVRPEGSALRALFPCKPVAETRAVELAGGPVTMTMLSCRAGETLFALAHADVVDPVRVGPALRELRAAAARNVGAVPPTAAPVAVRGMTPNSDAGRVGLDGRRPDGRGLHEEVATFARGTRVYQATVLGESPDATAVDTFLSELAVTP